MSILVGPGELLDTYWAYCDGGGKDIGLDSMLDCAILAEPANDWNRRGELSSVNATFPTVKPRVGTHRLN